MVSLGSTIFAEDGEEEEGDVVVMVSLGLEEESLESSSSVGEEGVDWVAVATGVRLGASLEAGRISILWISLVGMKSGAVFFLCFF